MMNREKESPRYLSASGMNDRASATKALSQLKALAWLGRRRIAQLATAFTVIALNERETIFDEKAPAEVAFILLSGAARITCRNRRGERIVVAMIAPGVIPTVPPRVSGIPYQFRCEAVSECRVGTVGLESFFAICLGVRSEDFKQMASSYFGRWEIQQLRCSNFMNCSIAERLALALLELSENFGVPGKQGVRLTLAVRHQDLADLVGVTRSRITLELMSFERERRIARRQRSITVKPKRLESLLS